VAVIYSLGQYYAGNMLRRYMDVGTHSTVQASFAPLLKSLVVILLRMS
jgi:hypothetical protein